MSQFYDPKVTVVVTCYNYGDFIEDTIRSVWDQSYKNIELIVINDGSVDDSDKIILKLKIENNFRYIKQPNKGIIDVRNKGLTVGQGEYIIQLDADDTLPKNYVSELIKVAKKTQADVTYSDYIMFGESTEKSNFPKFTIEELKNHNYINISALVKLDFIGSTRFDENLRKSSHEDWDFFLQLATKGAKFVKCDTTYLNYRIHGKSRNNIMKSFKQRRNYIDTYTYIINKHVNTNPGEFAFLSIRWMSGWYNEIDDRANALNANNKVLKDTLVTVQGQIDSIINSKKYKILTKIATHLHHFKHRQK